eukprot:GHRQ01005859.1.p1 GENE.GHRQ01005859.1~~GHRQ01005859.1.p1  ORF type:complete len:107 (-),score=4.18 GHRQ01005859.1:94-414(-)
MAFFTFRRSAFSSFSHFTADLLRVLAMNFKLNTCSSSLSPMAASSGCARYLTPQQVRTDRLPTSRRILNAPAPSFVDRLVEQNNFYCRARATASLSAQKGLEEAAD